MTIKSVGIVGSGIMGSGIAEVAAKSGHTVVLRSRQQESADAMVASLDKSLAKQVERGKLTAEERDATLARVTATSRLHDLADCDLVIESVVEDLAIKQELFRELNEVCKDDAILATNTSTLPVIEMAMETPKSRQGVRRPLLQPGAHDEPGRDRAPPHRQRRDHRRGARLRRGVRQEPGRGQGPGRLHRQRPALPLPQQRRAHARERHGQPRRHRHRHEGRLQLPDGARWPCSTSSASTPRWPSSTPSTPSSATRTTRRCRCCAAW